jgi:hypothetical protein
MNKENENKNGDDVLNMTVKLWNLEEENKKLENEIVSYQRRLWKQYSDLIDIAGVIREIEEILGKDRVQRIYLKYLKNQKAEDIKRQREIAETVEYGLDFKGLFHLDE